MRASGKRVLAAITSGLLVAAVVVGVPYVRTAAFLLDLAGVTDGVRAWIPIATVPTTAHDIGVPTRFGDVPVRVYEPDTSAPPTVVVFPGVHGGGVDAPRLVQLCGRLAGSGLRVVCAPLPDLREFVITSRSTDMIEDVTAWVSMQPALAPASRVTLVGVSFAGGLAVVAAGRPSLDGRLAAVVSIGGHGDLRRTLRYLTTGALPDGTERTPHDYPLAIVALTVADHLVPATQVDVFTNVVRTFLTASLDDGTGFAHGIPVIERLRNELDDLPEPTRTLARAIVERDVAATGRAVAPFTDTLAADPGLSPSLSPLTTAPVFLLHGASDNVIPSTETPLLAAEFETRGLAAPRWLLTPLLSHAHLATSAPAGDLWQLLRFWRDVRGAVEH